MSVYKKPSYLAMGDLEHSVSKRAKSQRFQLQFSCENLVNKLAVGQPKPQVIVYINNKKLGETEISSGLSPTFSQTIGFDYVFGRRQNVQITVKNTIWHIIKRSEDKMTFGRNEVPFDLILQGGSRGVKLKLKATPTKDEKKLGKKYIDGGRIYVSAFPDNPYQSRFRIDASVKGVPAGMLSTPTTFLEFTVPNERNRLLYRSENKKGKESDFLAFEITQGRMPDFSEDVQVACYEYQEEGRIKLQRDNRKLYKSFGSCRFKPESLFRTGNGHFPLSGKTLLTLENVRHYPATFSTFHDYIRAGLQLKFSLAIDFSTNSFAEHGAENNPYIDAIRSFGGIMESYDDDGKIPAYCFSNEPKACWQVRDQEISLNDLLDEYVEAVENHDFEEGPCHLLPVIEQLVQAAADDFHGSADSYYVLVVLSSGRCDDLDQVIVKLRGAAQNVPFSIINVGIGDNMFTAFDRIQKKLNHRNLRQLSTFVNTAEIPLPNYDEVLERQELEKEFQDEFMSSDEEIAIDLSRPALSPELMKYELQMKRLSEKAMEDIPMQVQKFFGDRRISPVQRRSLERSGTVSNW